MFETHISKGLDALSVPCNDSQVARLADYLRLLQKWNKVYNLTAIDDEYKMVAYHILDSLAIHSAIPEQACCLDVGTGAGLPGIPLAILLPQSNWVLIDSNGKKTRFVQQAIAGCGLDNVKVVQARIQDYDADSSFDVIVSRAYASLQDFMSSVEHLWQVNTRLITMKTELSESELSAVDKQGLEFNIAPLQVPGIAEKRSLVSIQRKEL